jgi:hypothetical protein
MSYLRKLKIEQYEIYKNKELEIKYTVDTQKSASYIDLHLEIDNGGRLKTKLRTNVMTSLF